MVNLEKCYEMYLRIAKSRIQNYELNEDESDQVKNLLNYFLYNKGPYENSKGLMIRGNVGVGKTLCLKIIQQMIPMDRRYRFTSANQISINFESDSLNYGFFRNHDYLIDDLGTESAANIYGKKEEVLSSFILDLYNNYQNTNRKYHFTTNATGEDILNKYGERAFDRLTEMVTPISWASNDSKRMIGIKTPPKSEEKEAEDRKELIDIEVFQSIYEWLCECKKRGEHFFRRDFGSGYIFDFLQDKGIINIDTEKKKSILRDSKESIALSSVITNGMMKKDYDAFKNGCTELKNHYYARAIIRSKNYSLKYWVETKVLTNKFNIEDLK